MGRKIDLTGKVFGKLTVIKEHPERTPQGSVQWLCKCECGKPTIVSGDNLRRNHTLSCGCLQKESAQKRVIDLTGQRFGKLVITGKAPNPTNGKNRHTFWYCDCDCGNTSLIKDGENIKRGLIISCGCIGTSKGEYQIKELLEYYGIEFEKEKTFDTCVFPDTKAKARFDFYLPAYNIVIEFDGYQHFYFTGYEWNTEENYLKTIEKDHFKTQWCKNNGISLIRIPYTHLSTLKIDDLLENSRFML